MHDGWRYWSSRDAAYVDNPQRDGKQADYPTTRPDRGWLDPDGVSYVLTFCYGTDELMLFARSAPDDYPCWTSPAWPDRSTADAWLAGWEASNGDWAWLRAKLAGL